ncbi:MAG: hypothetical protein J6A63_10670 [Clostridia bacterium]|nr:hypothetical protein [Clostridia bacterium]
MKKLTIMLLIAILAATLLCACGQGAQSSSETNSESSISFVSSDSSTSSTSSEERAEPEFPDNGFDVDNEGVHPEIWG